MSAPKDDPADYRSKLAAQPCECVPCADCQGTGTVWFSFDNKYLGNGRCDDLDRLERCEQCNGGIIESCSRCEELYSMDEDWL